MLACVLICALQRHLFPSVFGESLTLPWIVSFVFVFAVWRGTLETGAAWVMSSGTKGGPANAFGPVTTLALNAEVCPVGVLLDLQRAR